MAQHQTLDEQDQRVQLAFRRYTERLTPEQRQQIVEYLEAAADTDGISGDSSDGGPSDEMLWLLTGGQLPSREGIERDRADQLKRGFELRRRLLAGSLTPSEVAGMLGTSRQTIHDRARKGSLLAIPDNGMNRYPAWQFDPGTPDGVIHGLGRVLSALRHLSPLAQASWLTRPHPAFDGETPLQALSRDEVDLVADLARGVEGASL